MGDQSGGVGPRQPVQFSVAQRAIGPVHGEPVRLPGG
jgi:hypothetical protein